MVYRREYATCQIERGQVKDVSDNLCNVAIVPLYGKRPAVGCLFVDKDVTVYRSRT